MTYPGPPGDPDERPLDGPDLGMGVPESGTQHATSTDYPLPLDRPAGPDAGSRFGAGSMPPDDTLGSAPLSRPTPPAYDDPADLVQRVEPTATAPVGEPAGRHAYPDGAGDMMSKVKAFADQRPALFLGIALLAGWLAGRVFSSSDDSDD